MLVVLLYLPACQAGHDFPPGADVIVQAGAFLAHVYTSLCNTAEQTGEVFTLVTSGEKGCLGTMQCPCPLFHGPQMVLLTICVTICL